MNKLITTSILGILLLLCSAFPGWTDDSTGLSRPVLDAESVVLLDYDTGTILFEKNADKVIPPASLAKLVTLYVVYSMAESGYITLDDVVEVPEQAWYVNMPAGSSLMFLGPGMKVTVKDLMLGLAVSSGNDAAVALAYYIAGSIEGFAALMNREMNRLGFTAMHFVEPSGLSEYNRITAREFAAFCRVYLRRFPQSLSELHSVKEYTFPYEALPADEPLIRRITQKNRNTLLWEMDGVDGLKTGYIEESGYNLAVTAGKNGMRLIGVVLGIDADNHLEGSEKRSREGRALLEYGFSGFVTVRPRDLALPSIKVWKGIEENFEIGPSEEVVVTVPVDDVSLLTTEVEVEPFIEAPVSKGERVGTLRVFAGGELTGTFPLVSMEDIVKAGLAEEIWDGLMLMIERRRYEKAMAD